MVRKHIFTAVCLGTALLGTVRSAKADVYPVIIIGKVTMPDGSPPPVIVSIERVCNGDNMGTAPGPLTNKKGEWVWRLEIDLYVQRSCVFHAHHDGYTSSTIDASNINENYLDKTVHVPDIILSTAIPDPYSIHINGDDFPGKAKGSFAKAMKALDAHNTAEAIKDLQDVTTTSPKFGEGWHALGVVYDKSGHPAEAKDAYLKAIDADPKGLQSYVALARVCVRLKDWQCAADDSERMTKVDSKHNYPEIYLHQAVARFELNDLAGAEQSADEMIKLDPKHAFPRVEYVLGRVLEAKGDINGAREHIMKYLSMDGAAKDAELVQAHMLALGKPEAASINPDLEVL